MARNVGFRGNDDSFLDRVSSYRDSSHSRQLAAAVPLNSAFCTSRRQAVIRALCNSRADHLLPETYEHSVHSFLYLNSASSRGFCHLGDFLWASLQSTRSALLFSRPSISCLDVVHRFHSAFQRDEYERRPSSGRNSRVRMTVQKVHFI